jgi:hypothetical protein
MAFYLYKRLIFALNDFLIPQIFFLGGFILLETKSIFPFISDGTAVTCMIAGIIIYILKYI